MNRATLALVIASSAFAADNTDLVREAALGWTAAADDLQFAHAGGQVQTKEQYIAAATKGPARYESFAFSDMKIRFYGKAAVLTAYCDVKMTGQDSFRVRTLQVYTESNGQWQMAAHQSTRVGR